MISYQNAFSSFSVPDLKAAKDFYSNVLGLKVEETAEGLQLHFANAMRVFVYLSPNNKPADFTVLNFIVDDIEATVDALAAQGAKMEQYDMPSLKTDAKGIARSEQGPRAMAWLKDPVGNIIGIMQE
jgi:predicted enzyme related to lactoylglutathione lyase